MNSVMNMTINEKLTPNLYFFEYKEHVLGLDKQSNAIFGINVKKGIIELKGVISKVYGIWSPFSKVVVYDESLFFIPYNYDKLLIYHISNGVWEELELGVNKDAELFLEAFIINNTMYLLPFNYEKIIKIDLKSRNVNYVDLYEKYDVPIKKKMFIKFLIMDDKIVILPIFSTNLILKYHMNGLIEKIELPYKNFQINSIMRGNDYIYLASRNSLEILKLNLNMEIMDCFKIQPNIVPIGTEYTYFDQYGFEFFANKLYCFPARWNHVVKINVENGKCMVLEALNILTTLDADSEKIRKFNHGIVLDSKLYIQNYDRKILIFDLKDETFQIISTEENDPNGINFKCFMRYIINL